VILPNGMPGLPRGWWIFYRHMSHRVEGRVCPRCIFKAKAAEDAWMDKYVRI
jgi:hypothetical protein